MQGSGNFRIGNQCAKKSTRRVELGSMDYSMQYQSYKQVRQRVGGGVRHLTVDRNMRMSEVLQYALETFFPGGNSQRGSAEEFHVELKDFQGQDVNLSRTVIDLYNDSKLKLMRVYLYTRRKDEMVCL